MSLEAAIEALTAAVIANTAALNSEEVETPTGEVATTGKKRGRKPATTPTQQAATSATSVSTTATAPAGAAGPATQSPVVSVSVTPAEAEIVKRISTKPSAELNALDNPDGLLFGATELILVLANKYSREAAVGILAKQRGDRPGVTRCSDLNKLDWRDVFNEAYVAVQAGEAAEAAKKAATVNQSLV